jgi:hypothetical protein
VGVYEYYVSKNINRTEALIKAKDLIAMALFNSVLSVNIKSKMFESIGRNMLSFLDEEEKDIVSKEFLRKGIFDDNDIIPLALTEEIPMAKKRLIKMKDYFQGDNPLYAVDIEVNSQECMGINDEENELINIKNSLDYLAETGKVDYNASEEEGKKEFKIENGKLVRNCCMFM